MGDEARGRFITFEGGDGSGKSTQVGMLADWVEHHLHREVVLSREPGGTPLGLEIRRLVQHVREHVAPRAEALLYAADRAQHVATVVRPALERGAIVVQDRYFDSSIAYQGAGRDLDPEEIRGLSLWGAEGLVPDLTILLDLDPEVGRARFGDDERPYDRLEEEVGDFPHLVRAKYLELAAAEPDRFFVVDATLSPEEIADRVAARASQLLQ